MNFNLFFLGGGGVCLIFQMFFGVNSSYRVQAYEESTPSLGHLYAKLDQNIPCGSRVMSISLIANGRTVGRTDSHSSHSADPRRARVVQSLP